MSTEGRKEEKVHFIIKSRVISGARSLSVAGGREKDLRHVYFKTKARNK